MAIKVVAALFRKNNKVLLAKRAKGNLKDKWEFPGGKIEEEEKPFDAIEREILEELGVKVRANKSIKTFKHKYDFGMVELELIECSTPTEKVFLDGSHSEVDFFVLDKLVIDLAPLDQKIVNFLKQL